MTASTEGAAGFASTRPVNMSEPSTQSRVLVVDDDVNLARLLRAILRTSGFEVVTSSDSTAALDMVSEQQFNVIILDLRMPVMDGRTFYRELRGRGHNTPVVISSAYGARAAQAELGAQAAIEKPFDPDKLVQTVSRLLDEGERAAH
jgi:CheY-like chemotaxis protein